MKIQPLPPQSPYVPDERALSCVNRSEYPEWKVENLLYQHHFAQLNNDTKTSYNLSLNLTNLSTNEKIACHTIVDEMVAPVTDGSSPWVDCGQPVRDIAVSSPTSEVSTWVMLDINNGVLGIEQEWMCDAKISGEDK